MNKEEINGILGAFSLINNPIVLSEEEIKDVQKAIKEIQQENKQLKDNWNMLKEILNRQIEKWQNVEYDVIKAMVDEDRGILLIMENVLEKSDSNE